MQVCGKMVSVKIWHCAIATKVTMKKLFLAILILSLLFATFAVIPASALSATESEKSYQPHANGYTLHSMVDGDGNPVGINFSKSYFGASGIAVSIQLYSDPNGFDLGFWIGGNSLTDDQLATRAKVVQPPMRLTPLPTPSTMDKTVCLRPTSTATTKHPKARNYKLTTTPTRC